MIKNWELPIVILILVVKVFGFIMFMRPVFINGCILSDRVLFVFCYRLLMDIDEKVSHVLYQPNLLLYNNYFYHYTFRLFFFIEEKLSIDNALRNILTCSFDTTTVSLLK